MITEEARLTRTQLVPSHASEGEGIEVRLRNASTRTKIIYSVWLGVSAISLAVVLALLLCLAAITLGVWRDPPVPNVEVLLVYTAVAVVALRLLVAWSSWMDRP